MQSDDVRKKLKTLQDVTESYVATLKELLHNQRNRPQCISYFTYALQLSHDTELESFCLGSLHIHNIGNQPLTNPTLHLHLSDQAPFTLNGKFVSNATALSSQLTNGWERINDRSEKSAFHLKPIGKTLIEPGETLSFTNFQLTWSPSAFYAGSVTATLFSDQQPDGVDALNSININGSMTTGKEQ